MPNRYLLSPHAALIYVMVLQSAADRDMSDAELRAIGKIVSYLPIFKGYDNRLIPQTAGAYTEILEIKDELEKALDLIKGSLEPQLRETEYAVACDVAAADGNPTQEELRMLEMIRHHLAVDRLTAAAI